MRKSAIRLTGTLGAAATAAVLAALPATAAAAFHTTFTVSGIGTSIAGTVVDTHEQGQPNFENETWHLTGLTPGASYYPVITIGGCDGTALPQAVLGYAITGNPAGNANTAFKVPRAALAAYLAFEGIDPATLGPAVQAQLLLVPAFPTDSNLVDTTAMLAGAVAKSDCQTVATS